MTIKITKDFTAEWYNSGIGYCIEKQHTFKTGEQYHVQYERPEGCMVTLKENNNGCKDFFVSRKHNNNYIVEA